MILASGHRAGILFVLSAGIFWSTSGILYRLLQEATPWHVLFYRSLALLGALLIWFVWRYRGAMSTKLVDAGVPALIGGLCLGTAFAGYILALEYTTVANAMFLLASAPFFAALAGRFLLGEGIASYTWVAMLVAAVGIAIMAGDELSLGKGLGEGFGLIAALGFAGLTVSLRARPQTDKLITIFFATMVAVDLWFYWTRNRRVTLLANIDRCLELPDDGVVSNWSWICTLHRWCEVLAGR